LNALSSLVVSGPNLQPVLSPQGFSQMATALGVNQQDAYGAFQRLSQGRGYVPASDIVNVLANNAGTDGVWDAGEFMKIGEDIANLGRQGGGMQYPMGNTAMGGYGTGGYGTGGYGTGGYGTGGYGTGGYGTGGYGTGGYGTGGYGTGGYGTGGYGTGGYGTGGYGTGGYGTGGYGTGGYGTGGYGTGGYGNGYGMNSMPI
jgi:hypothetical protein